jgi:uncharacterized membrane protein
VTQFFQWVFYALPWWLQLTLLAIPVLVAFYFAVRIFGFDRVKGFIAPALAILAALGLLSRARQQGYQDRKDIQEKAQDDALKDFDQTKKAVDDETIQQVDKDNQPWIKP